VAVGLEGWVRGLREGETNVAVAGAIFLEGGIRQAGFGLAEENTGAPARLAACRVVVRDVSFRRLDRTCRFRRFGWGNCGTYTCRRGCNLGCCLSILLPSLPLGKEEARKGVTSGQRCRYLGDVRQAGR